MTVSRRGRPTTVTTVEPAATSFGRLFLDRVVATPDTEAFRYPTGSGWAHLSWAATGDRVTRLAAGLLALGLQSEERVAIACSTRVEWVLADFAVMCAGGAVTTVYPSTLPEDVGYIVADSQSRFVVAEDETQVEKLRAHRDRLGAVEKVIVVDGPLAEADGDWVMTFAALEDLGRQYLAERPTAVDDAVAASQPDHLATLIYTSGTTGRPKGVAAHPRQLALRGRRRRRARHPAARRRAVPVAAAGALVRQDAARDPVPGRLRVRRRRARRQDRRQPRRRAADVHGRRAADLREGVRPRRRARRGGGRGAPEDLPLGVRRRVQGGRGTPRRPRARRRAEGPARRRRPAGLQQDQGTDGRPDPLLLLGQRGALARGGPVVRGRRAGDPRGLRADRDQRGDHAEPAGSGRLRHRRPADAGHRGQDRRRRRDPGPRRRRHARLPQPARADGGGAARRRVVRDRRRRRARRPGAGAHHRPQEGPAQDLAAASTSRRSTSSRSSRRSARSRARWW